MNRENFDQEIKNLIADSGVMMDMTLDILQKTIKSMESQDMDLAKKIYKLDDKIDDIMHSIEDRCVELIALQQPNAKDLRIVFSIIKIITDLERMGDYCVNIAREVLLIGKDPLMKEAKYIYKMKEIIAGMIVETKKSWLEEDRELASQVADEDELIDSLFADLYNGVMMNVIQDKSSIPQGTRLLFMGRFLERMADHLTNVCEKIIYINTGEMVELN